MTQAPNLSLLLPPMTHTHLTYGLLLVQAGPRPFGSHTRLLSALPLKTNGQFVGVFSGQRFKCV